MDEMMCGAMNPVWEAAARQLVALVMTGAVCTAFLLMAACLTAGILRRLR